MSGRRQKAIRKHVREHYGKAIEDRAVELTKDKPIPKGWPAWIDPKSHAANRLFKSLCRKINRGVSKSRR